MGTTITMPPAMALRRRHAHLGDVPSRRIMRFVYTMRGMTFSELMVSAKTAAVARMRRLLGRRPEGWQSPNRGDQLAGPRTAGDRTGRQAVRRLLLCGVVMLALLKGPPDAWAYRPFVSTDAAVADPREVEIELGYFNLAREKGENTFVIPQVVLNYGVVKNWEIVGEFGVQRSPNADLDIVDPGLSLKAVLKEGVLQEKGGISIAVEAGPLLPSTERGERHVGFEATGILSGRLGPVTYHVNAGGGVQRSNSEPVFIWGLIGELPVLSNLRVVSEVNGETPWRESDRHSALLGVIWQPWSSRNLFLDTGIRRGLSRGVPDWQVTLGLTVGFSLSALR